MLEVVGPTGTSKQDYGAYRLNRSILERIYRLFETYIPAEVTHSWGKSERNIDLIVSANGVTFKCTELDDIDHIDAHGDKIYSVQLKAKNLDKYIEIEFNNRFSFYRYNISHDKFFEISVRIDEIIKYSRSWYSMFYAPLGNSLSLVFVAFSLVSTYVYIDVQKSGVSISKNAVLLLLLSAPYFLLAISKLSPHFYPGLCFDFGMERDRLTRIEQRRKFVIATILGGIAVIGTLVAIAKNMNWLSNGS